MDHKDCLFCKIADGTIAAAVVHRDEKAVAFSDVNPQAPVHVLVIPRDHVTSLAQIEDKDSSLLGHLMNVARRVAKEKGLNEDGYRVVVNTGQNGGQTVFHLHVHVMGGRSFRWPPG